MSDKNSLQEIFKKSKFMKILSLPTTFLFGLATSNFYNDQLNNELQNVVDFKSIPNGFQMEFSPLLFNFLTYAISFLIIGFLVYLSFNLFVFVGIRAFSFIDDSYQDYKNKSSKKMPKILKAAKTAQDKLMEITNEPPLVPKKAGRKKKLTKTVA